MSILATHLRSPEQRRSDNLTILTRRAPPPQSCGRFFKVSAENGVQVHNFDPSAFDSDAETDGPPSGSFAWRREHSRIRTSLSLNSISSRLDPDSTQRRTRPSLTRRPSTPTLVPFSRDRASSFYHGKSRLHQSISNDDIIGAVNPQRLQQLLGEDYVLFCSNSKTAPPQRPDRHTASSNMPRRAARPARSTFFSSRRPGFSMSLVSAGSFRAESDEERDVEQFSRMLVAERGNDQRPSCASIPLFVEEIGRVPRVAVVDGKARRVRVRRPRGGSYHPKPSNGLGGGVIMRCFGICLHPTHRRGDEE
ncbi:unnamed protein product [Agarophyton chilense]